MHWKCAFAAIAAGSVVSLGNAAIVAVGGQVTQIAQPLDARFNVLTNPNTAYCWNEIQNFALDRSVAIDAFAPGTYKGTLTYEREGYGAQTITRDIRVD